jgi:hypothetical protein
MDTRRTFFVVYLALQISIPFVQLFRPRPARFAWQMFSGISVPLRIKVKSGEERRNVDIAEVVGNWRADLMPPFLCRRFPDASSVLLYYLETDEPREIPCNR